MASHRNETLTDRGTAGPTLPARRESIFESEVWYHPVVFVVYCLVRWRVGVKNSFYAYFPKSSPSVRSLVRRKPILLARALMQFTGSAEKEISVANLILMVARAHVQVPGSAEEEISNLLHWSSIDGVGSVPFKHL